VTEISDRGSANFRQKRLTKILPLLCRTVLTINKWQFMTFSFSASSSLQCSLFFKIFRLFNYFHKIFIKFEIVVYQISIHRRSALNMYYFYFKYARFSLKIHLLTFLNSIHPINGFIDLIICSKVRFGKLKLDVRSDTSFAKLSGLVCS
jgi:hypothetical protein